MAGKPKGCIAPRIDEALLAENFSEQLASGSVHDALAVEMALPLLVSPRGQATSIEGCIWRSVTLSDPKAQRLHLRDRNIRSRQHRHDKRRARTCRTHRHPSHRCDMQRNAMQER